MDEKELTIADIVAMIKEMQATEQGYRLYFPEEFVRDFPELLAREDVVVLDDYVAFVEKIDD